MPVVAIVRIYPSEGVDLEQLKKRVSAVEGFRAAEAEPIAFGANALKASFLLSEEKPVDIEAVLKGIEGVSEVQMLEVTLI